MTKCNICGLEKKHIIKCSNCYEEVCFNCFWFSLGLCADCIVSEYNEKYKEKISAYNEIETFNNNLSIGG